MARWPKISEYEFERYLNGHLYVGESFFGTRNKCKQVAREVRKQFHVSARAIVIPESYTSGGHYGGYIERYLLMLPCDQDIPQAAIEYIHQQAKI